MHRNYLYLAILRPCWNSASYSKELESRTFFEKKIAKCLELLKLSFIIELITPLSSHYTLVTDLFSGTQLDSNLGSITT